MTRPPPRSTLFPYTTLFRSTIRKNLKNYNQERKVIIPDSFHFFARQNRRKEWNVILCMDQSGSMADSRSEEHTSELQSQFHLVCRLLLEKKKKIINNVTQKP